MQLAVCDTGTGISPEVAVRMFQEGSDELTMIEIDPAAIDVVAVPAVAFGWLVAQAPIIVPGGSLIQTTPWIPTLGVDLAYRIGTLQWVLALLLCALGIAELRLDWMERELARARSATRMQRWAAQALREDASEARRALAIRAFTDAPGAEPVVAVEQFLHDNAGAARRLDTLMRALSREGDPDLAGVTLAVRQLRALVG